MCVHLDFPAMGKEAKTMDSVNCTQALCFHGQNFGRGSLSSLLIHLCAYLTLLPSSGQRESSLCLKLKPAPHPAGSPQWREGDFSSPLRALRGHYKPLLVTVQTEEHSCFFQIIIKNFIGSYNTVFCLTYRPKVPEKKLISEYWAINYMRYISL